APWRPSRSCEGPAHLGAAAPGVPLGSAAALGAALAGPSAAQSPDEGAAETAAAPATSGRRSGRGLAEAEAAAAEATGAGGPAPWEAPARAPFVPAGPLGFEAQGPGAFDRAREGGGAGGGGRAAGPSPACTQDTAIGAGLGALLRRTVQGAPATGEEHTAGQVLSGSGGGHVATFQRGAGGLPGHRTPFKEDLLRQRGPVPAPEYEAVPGDELDQRVQHLAVQLPGHLGECLRIWRVARGEYEIGADRVRLEWRSQQVPSGPRVQEVASREVFVVGGGEKASEPLPLYLRHTASVAYDLQFGGPLAKVPQRSRLSFAEQVGIPLAGSDGEAKFAAMAVATEQARLREKAAAEWQRAVRSDAASSLPQPYSH
ncbi:unnamed protein product, partial [Prorocentrum cordatum]